MIAIDHLTRTYRHRGAAITRHQRRSRAEAPRGEWALEVDEDNPYANFLVVKAGDEEEPAVVLLAELLQSDEVRTFIEESCAGAVLPAFQLDRHRAIRRSRRPEPGGRL